MVHILAVMISSLFILAVLATIVSSQTDSCAGQHELVRLLDQLIETKVNDTLLGDTLNLLDLLVNRIDERIESKKINRTLDSELEMRVQDLVAGILAAEPGE